MNCQKKRIHNDFEMENKFMIQRDDGATILSTGEHWSFEEAEARQKKEGEDWKVVPVPLKSVPKIPVKGDARRLWNLWLMVSQEHNFSQEVKEDFQECFTKLFCK